MSEGGGKRRAAARAGGGGGGGSSTTAGLLGLGLDVDLGESSSDSDFRIEDHPDEGSDDDDDDDDSQDEEEDDDDDEGSDGEDGGGGGGGRPNGTSALALDSLLDKANSFQLKGIEKTLICAGCLGSRSDDANEIVECDGCGVTVHEGCYGVADAASESSAASSADTEPWFCDACKAGLTDPSCELCPNKGGIFKETEVGAWVHLVCALYVPGVAFSEVDRLAGVTLFEMAYSRWGARACSLCEDERFARTGICVGCDAGLCRTYFHVTCGQREGLLAEAHAADEQAADPFYAHCRLHSDRALIKKQRRNWLALQLRTAQRKREIQADADSEAHRRTLRKLEKYRKRFLAAKATRKAPWVPTQKMPRLLPTSATACRKLMHKAALMGIDTVASELQDAQIASLADVKKKWHIPPAFSVEFIGYYLDRNNRMDSMKRSLEGLLDANTDLLAQQKELDDDFDKASKESNDSVAELATLKEKIAKLHGFITKLCPGKIVPDVETIGISAVPAVPITTRRTTPFPTAAALKMGVGFPLNSNPKEHAGKVLSTSKQAENPELLLNNECGICRMKNDQHLLAKCDTCHLYYHLGCLKPPLTRLPKKSKLYGWQCSECDKSSESEADVNTPKAPRRSRTRFSKDGTVVPVVMDTSPVEAPPPPPTCNGKPAKTKAAAKDSVVAPFKVTIKPVEPPPVAENPLDVYSLPDDMNEDEAPPPLSRAALKKEKKARKIKLKQGLCYEPSSDQPVTKKSRKRSFTSPQLTNTPLMSITPIVAESPTQGEEGGDVPVSVPNQITSDTSFLSASSSFTALLRNSDGNEATDQFNNEDQVSYKANRKRRKEKHRSRYSPDVMRPSKSHKHKRKKRSQSRERVSVEENPDVPHPRITIKIKPIPKPAGSVDPQLFYVPTDSNDGPPPDLLKKQASKHRHKEQKEETVPTPPPVVEPPVASPPPVVATPPPPNIVTPPPVATEEPPKTSPRKKKSVDSRQSTEAPPQPPKPGRRSTSTPATPVSNDLTQCDVCSNPGTNTNLVRCDECGKRYHFTCLEPPLNKNPKKRGYSWHCADCDPTDVES